MIGVDTGGDFYLTKNTIRHLPNNAYNKPFGIALLKCLHDVFLRVLTYKDNVSPILRSAPLFSSHDHTTSISFPGLILRCPSLSPSFISCPQSTHMAQETVPQRRHWMIRIDALFAMNGRRNMCVNMTHRFVWWRFLFILEDHRRLHLYISTIQLCCLATKHINV